MNILPHFPTWTAFSQQFEIVGLVIGPQPGKFRLSGHSFARIAALCFVAKSWKLRWRARRHGAYENILPFQSMSSGLAVASSGEGQFDGGLLSRETNS